MAAPTSSYSKNVILSQVSGSTIKKVGYIPLNLSGSYGNIATIKSLFHLDGVIPMKDSYGNDCFIGVLNTQTTPNPNVDMHSGTRQGIWRITSNSGSSAGKTYTALTDGGLNTKAMVTPISIPTASTSQLMVSYSFMNAYYASSSKIVVTISGSNGRTTTANFTNYSTEARTGGHGIMTIPSSSLPTGLVAGNKIGVRLAIENEEGTYTNTAQVTASVTSSAPYYVFTWGDSSTIKTVNVAAAGGNIGNQSVICTQGGSNANFSIGSVAEVYQDTTFIANTSTRVVSGYVEPNYRYNAAKTGSILVRSSWGDNITLKVQQAGKTYARREIYVQAVLLPNPDYSITTYVTRNTSDEFDTIGISGEGGEGNLFIPNIQDEEGYGQGGWMTITTVGSQLGYIHVGDEVYYIGDRFFVPSSVNDILIRTTG